MEKQVYNIDLMWLVKRRKEVTEAANEEIRIINDKYKDILDRQEAASEELNRMIDEFRAKWNYETASYKREIAAVKRKHKRLLDLAEKEARTPKNGGEQDV